MRQNHEYHYTEHLFACQVLLEKLLFFEITYLHNKDLQTMIIVV